MTKKAFVVIDIQNDTPKNYKGIIDNINKMIEWAVQKEIQVIYIRNENLSTGARLFKPNTYGAELAQDLNVVSQNIFTKYKSNSLSSEEFMDFINKNEIHEFYITGADATICVKSTCYNLRKLNYDVHVLKDCISSYDHKKINDMLAYYEAKGCSLLNSTDFI